MSNIAPFGEGAEQLPAIDEQSGAAEVFKAPLDGVDWAAYEERQEQIDQALQTGDPDALAAIVAGLHAHNSELGVKLNNLHNTTLRGKLAGLNAPLAVMSRTKVEADIPGFNFNGGVAPRANFSDRDLRGAEFVDSVLTEAEFKGADVSGVDFTNATLTGADFTGAKAFGADFSGAYLVGVKGFDNSEVIRGVRLNAARTVILEAMDPGSLEQYLAGFFGDATDLETIKRKLDPVPVAVGVTIPRLQTKRNLRGLVARQIDATDVDFSSSQLVGAKIENMIATGAQFRNAMASGAIITGSMMRGVDLVSTWAPGIILEDVDLRGSRVTNANLVGAVLRGVDLREVDGLDAQDTNLEGVVIEDCKLPQGYGYNGRELERSQKATRGELKS